MEQFDPLNQDFLSLDMAVRHHAQFRPSAIALRQDQLAISYGELDRLLDGYVNGIAQITDAPGDVVAICARNSVFGVAALIATLRAGRVAALISPQSSEAALRAMLDDARPRLAFVEDGVVETHAAAFAVLDADIIPMHGTPLRPSSEAFGPAGELAPGSISAVDPDAPMTIIYSSGTTGQPKGIVHSHRFRWGFVKRSLAHQYAHDTVSICATPIYSNTTLAVLFPTLYAGGCSVVMEKFSTRGFLELSETHRVSHVVLVPVQYQRLMRDPEFDSFDLSSFKVKFCTSAPFRADLKADVVKRWPGALIEVYGMTEGGATTVLLAHEHRDKLHTVGRVSAGHEIRIIDEKGQQLAGNEVGEIVGYSPTIMDGYYNRPDLDGDIFWRSPEGRVFVRTGDMGSFDEDGFLILADRKKDVIISGGFNVYSTDLESVLLSHPGVEEASVVGVHSQEWGETPVAFIVPKAGTSLVEGELLDWANQQLSKFQRLSGICVVEDLPRNAIGKVLKRELRDMWKASENA